MPFAGGCACGAIRYECSAEPLFMGNCHCQPTPRCRPCPAVNRPQQLQHKGKGNADFFGIHQRLP